MALSRATVSTSCRSETHRRLGAMSRELAHDRWIESEDSAKGNPLELQRHRKCHDRRNGRLCRVRYAAIQTQAAHHSRSMLRGRRWHACLRLLPHKSFCISFYHKTYSLTRRGKTSPPELQGTRRRIPGVTLLCPELMRGQALGLGTRLSANPTISHDTPRKMMLMPTSTPMIVSPDIGSSRQIITPSTTSIAPLRNSQPHPSNR